jgi:methylmalonyl-CoA mutase cobalamin-binding subunit
VNAPRRILLIDPLGDGHPDVATPLAQALERAGAKVRRISLPGQSEAVLDAIEQGWLPVALKATAGAPRTVAHRDPAAGPSAPAADGGKTTFRPDTPPP